MSKSFFLRNCWDFQSIPAILDLFVCFLDASRLTGSSEATCKFQSMPKQSNLTPGPPSAWKRKLYQGSEQHFENSPPTELVALHRLFMLMRNVPSWKHNKLHKHINSFSLLFLSSGSHLADLAFKASTSVFVSAEKEPRFITVLSSLRRWSKERVSRLHAVCYLPVQYHNFT